MVATLQQNLIVRTNKREKMVVIFSNKGKIIFLEMEKFQRWIIGRDIEWACHLDIFCLLDMQLSLI